MTISIKVLFNLLPSKYWNYYNILKINSIGWDKWQVLSLNEVKSREENKTLHSSKLLDFTENNTVLLLEFQTGLAKV